MCFRMSRFEAGICVSHLSTDDTSMTPPADVTAEQCMHVAPPSDGAARCEPQTVSSAQTAHFD